MITKNEIKYIRELHLAKNRQQKKLFVAEGRKVVSELLKDFTCQWLLHTEDVDIRPNNTTIKLQLITASELERITLQKTPQGCLGIFDMPSLNETSAVTLKGNLTLALDGVQDPGNLGSIIRTAAWYGINNIVCSTDTADPFSPKVVQATMGALGRVNFLRTDLASWLKNLNATIPTYGTFLDGHNIYDEKLPKEAIIIMGNEGRGISKEIAQLTNYRLTIPHYPSHTVPQIESLNVALATAIVCDNFRRNAKG